MLLLALSTAQAVPTHLNHSGRLLDGTGLPLSGPHSVALALYDTETNTVALWNETQSLSFEEGYFSAELGLSSTLDDSLLEEPELWIGIAVDGGAELSRLRISSVPWARRAGTAASADVATDLNGGVVDASEIRVNGNVVIDGTGAVTDTLQELTCSADQIALFDGGSWICSGTSVDWADVQNAPEVVGNLSCSDLDGVRWDALNGWHCDSNLVHFLDLDPLATSGDWSDVQNVPADLADGDADDWSEIANIPADIADGDADDWTEIANIPGGFADNVDDDGLGALTCTAAGDAARWDGTQWQCTALTAADVGALDLGGGVLSGSLTLGDDASACNAGNAGTIKWSGSALEVCTGNGWQVIVGNNSGLTQAEAALTCSQLLIDYPSTPNGAYWIDPDGGSTGNAFRVQCDMVGGGLTRLLPAFKSYSWRNNQCGGSNDPDCVPDTVSGHLPHHLAAQGAVDPVTYEDEDGTPIPDAQLAALAGLSSSVTANVEVWQFDGQVTSYSAEANYYDGSNVNVPALDICCTANNEEWGDSTATAGPYVTDARIFRNFDITPQSNWGVFVHFLDSEIWIQ